MAMPRMSQRVIWPANIDALKTRKGGRIIPKNDAVKSPNIGEIETAARELGFNPTCEPSKSYPRTWWEKSGRVLIDKVVSKQEAAKIISQKIKAFRAQTPELQVK
jgi:signal recognition particle subunit SRP19